MLDKKLSPLVRLLDVVLKEQHIEKKYVLGKILTIIDASISDERANKAMKDLIMDAYWSSSLNDSFRRSIKRILVQFADKFCEELSPKTDEDLFQFGIKKNSHSPSDQSNQNYFPSI